MKSSQKDLLITLFLVAAVVLSVWLVNDEIVYDHVCPLLISIPACYYVFALFCGALGLHLLQKYRTLFYAIITSLGALALFASIGEASGYVSCPRLFLDIPTCYLSLIICASVLLLKRSAQR